jgi:RNA polymerase sigma-70 factor (ECF subfamily)
MMSRIRPFAMANMTLTLPDEELAQRASAAGDNACFAELFVRHRRKVYYACRAFFGNTESAEDATQETFLRAYRSIDSFQAGDFRGWLLRIARNVCIDEWRRSRRETSIEDLALSGCPTSDRLDSSSEARLMAERARKEIRLLPIEQRRCLELKIEGFSYEETAIRLGLTLNAVKSHLQNGRRMLWRKLATVSPVPTC